MNALLAHGREVTAEATKDRRPFRSAKPARDLLSHLHYANILFGQVVLERLDELMHKAQDQPLIRAQAIQ